MIHPILLYVNKKYNYCNFTGKSTLKGVFIVLAILLYFLDNKGNVISVQRAGCLVICLADYAFIKAAMWPPGLRRHS